MGEGGGMGQRVSLGLGDTGGTKDFLDGEEGGLKGYLGGGRE
jgi:hypothetical protein